MKKNIKPPKKMGDIELFTLIEEKITMGDYVFLRHAKKRLRDRNVLDTDVLNILENNGPVKRKRNKAKDIYLEGRSDWNYCIEGTDADSNRVRVVVTFDVELMLIITVIRLE